MEMRLVCGGCKRETECLNGGDSSDRGTASVCF